MMDNATSERVNKLTGFFRVPCSGLRVPVLKF